MQVPPPMTLLCVLDLRSAAQPRPQTPEQVVDAAATLAPDGVLELVGPPHPQPLLDRLGAAGYAAEALQGSDGIWIVRVSRRRLPAFEDLTGLEPPLPLQRVLEACAALERGAVYTAWLPRRPLMLFPHLDARALEWQAQDHPDGSATLWVKKP